MRSIEASLLVVGLHLVACGRGEIAWTIECAAGACDGAVGLHASIIEGSCSGTVRAHRSVLTPDAFTDPLAPAPLPDGAYGFAAVALGADCTVLASGCTDVTLPAPSLEVSLGGASRPACEGEGCAVAALSAGAFHTCAVRASGALDCWGDGSAGQIRERAPARVPLPMPVALEDIASVSAGAAHTCAVADDQTLRCWGESAGGQLGGEVSGEVPGVWSRVAAGAAHTCAIDRDGAVWCWGDNAGGQLGVADVARSMGPVRTSIEGATRVCAGDRSSCAIAGGVASCWGEGDSQPLVVPGTWSDVACGARHACVLAGGAIACFGQNDEGQLGDDSAAAPVDAPVRIEPLTGRTWIALDASTAHTCAIDDAGELRCWGRNEAGQLGVTGDAMGPRLARAGVGLVATGAQHTCVAYRDGHVECFGANDRGQLGAGAAPAPGARACFLAD